ncbi:conserved unknown protein [Ectocarpus siliculosus]|uniref:Sulfotransferase n=1 Tax=Ectocarpus siliculosus TaxID=2880 RepID=D7G716_ECTSI|nr:conserved unknown protein [Ectocarpus siliculosus]|eukprot:CBJ25709.1 conserved unknown protein [Ectocarpus siliculosus]
MRASFLPPWSKIALCVFACVCSLAYLSKAAVHPAIVAPPKPDDASSAEGQYSAEGRFSAEGQHSARGRHSAEERHSAEDRYGAAPRPQQAAAAEEEEETKAAAPGVLEVGATTPGSAVEEGHGSLRSREGEVQEGKSHEDGIDGTPDGGVALAGDGASRSAASVAATVQSPASPGQCWVFMHLQKCGGSTVKDLLEDRWGSRFFIYDSMRWKFGDEFSAKFGAKLALGDKWNVMTGGYTEALRLSEPVGAGCRFFTLFRHPIARMVSAYFYCRSVSGDVACASEVMQAKDVDLLTFAKHWGNFALRQFALGFVPSDDVQEYQLKMYLERPQKEDGGVLGQREAMTAHQDAAATPDAPLYELLQPAMDLVRDGYVAVGILEQWNTTLRLFDHTLDMPVMNWEEQFAESGKHHVDIVNKQLEIETLQQAWTDSELKKYMRLDLLLYEHAVDVFHQQARSHGLL